MKKRVGLFVIVLLIIIFSVAGYSYIHHRIVYAITDAVFTESDSLTNLSFQLVGGKILTMPYEEGDFVKKGAILAKLDTTEIENARKRLVFQIDALKEKLASLIKERSRIKKQISINKRLAKLSVSSAGFQIASAVNMLKSKQALLAKIRRDYMRAKNLFIHHALSRVKYQDAKTLLTSTKNEIASLKKKIEALKLKIPVSMEKLKLAINEKKRVGEITSNIAALKNQIKALSEQIKSIDYRITQSSLYSPFDGIIAKRYQNVGSVVAPGMYVYSIVNPDSIYVYALLSETKLKGVNVGSPVNIKIDAYPNKKYKGIVEAILPTTAAKFSLVPRDIAAGEFTKVAQRIGIRIKITKGDISKLRIGLGGSVEIKRTE